jgi:hypothetical protein
MAEQLTPRCELSRRNSSTQGSRHASASRSTQRPIQSGHRKRRVRRRGRDLNPNLPAMLCHSGGNPGHDSQQPE